MGHSSTAQPETIHSPTLNNANPQSRKTKAPNSVGLCHDNENDIVSKILNSSSLNEIPDKSKTPLFKCDDSSHNSAFRSSMLAVPKNQTSKFAVLVILLGFLATSLLLYFGISGANQEQQQQFNIRAGELINELREAWADYETAALWLHESSRSNNMTRSEFREVYEYMLASRVEVQAVEWIINVTDNKREALEAEASSYYAKFYPEIDYDGIIGFEPDDNSDTGYAIQNRSRQPFYFPVHFVEPVIPNAKAIEFDLYSNPSRKETLLHALNTWEPAVSPRLILLQDANKPHPDYSVLLFHPGIPLVERPDLQPHDLALLVIKIHDVLIRATRNLPQSISLYLYDKTNEETDGVPSFLGAAAASVLEKPNGGPQTELVRIPAITLEELRHAGTHFYFEDSLSIASSSNWTVAVVALENTYEPDIKFMVLAGMIILVACICLASWIFSNMRRSRALAALKSQAEGEKAAMIVENAQRSAKVERELNDYIAHEVRNPLAAAISACSFVKTEVRDMNAEEPVITPSSLKSLREDVNIIESSLQFINELLRNMLDMHKAASKKLKVDLVPLDMLEDVLKPVAAMLYQRDEKFKIRLECRENMILLTDRLRLKQIVLNLGRNSMKFVSQGYIKLGAKMIDGLVSVYVEDSGPGIPLEKRKELFSKFQESLDEMNQGTGIGLSLCKHMVELLGGEIRLDDSFDSGIEGCKGTRFIVDLKIAPMSEHEYAGYIQINDSSEEDEETGLLTDPAESQRHDEGGLDDSAIESQEQPVQSKELPLHLSVLFVDDDMVLRKLFTRSLKKLVGPEWNIKEAASGEAALKMIEENHNFDLIFLDQYMASVEKQMLGTEVARELRARGVKARICGLSANDVEEAFLKAGADNFMFKPFPCEQQALKKELFSIMFSPSRWNTTMTVMNGSGHSDSTVEG